HRYTLMKDSNSCIKFTIPGDEKRLKEWRKSRKKMEVDTHISKTESTNVVIEAAANQVIELRNDVEETAGTEEQTSKEFDNRIDYKWSKQVVKDYFILKFVQTKDKNGQSYFS